MIVGYKGQNRIHTEYVETSASSCQAFKEKKLSNIIFCIPEQLTYAFEESEKKIFIIYCSFVYKGQKTHPNWLEEICANM